MTVCKITFWFRTAVGVFEKLQAPVVQRLNNAIHRINHYPVDSVVCFVNTYPLDSDLSGGERYPAFEQLGLVNNLACTAVKLASC